MGFDIRTETLKVGSTIIARAFYDETALTFRQVVELWISNAAFVDRFVGFLRQVPFSGFRWETPPVTQTLFDRSFECVLLNAPSLCRTVDRHAFAEHFSKDGDLNGVVEFENLGRDAKLVVPCPGRSLEHYGHLASFSRHADREQQIRLWKAVGACVLARLSDKPLWLSTAGMGVAWLHVRIDDRPKYYGYNPYRKY